VAPNPNYAAPAPPYAVPPAQYSPPNPPPSYYGQMPQSGQSPDNYPPGYQYPPQTPPSETPQSYSENPYQESQKNTAEPTLPQLNLEPNLAAALSYMFWVVSGAYFLFTERENQFVRFHAMQSIVFGAAWIMFYFVSSFFLIIISSILSLIGIPAVWKLFGLLVNGIYLIWFGIWIMLMYKAYNKETFSLPVLGDIASKQLKHWNKQL
jgi:uncharacterized membrane protein